jgi:hypothetical protein
MCVKYPAAVPKPAPPKITSHELFLNSPIKLDKTPTVNSRSVFPEDGGGKHCAEKRANGSMVVSSMRSSLFEMQTYNGSENRDRWDKRSQDKYYIECGANPARAKCLWT